MQPKEDRRSHRTRRSLSEALVSLIKEKRFDDITVQNVIDRAEVGRSTFYSHFRDKEDLFQRDWERFLDMFAQHVDWQKAKHGSFVPVASLVQHLQEYHDFYKGLVRSRKADAVFKTGTAHLSKRLEESLTAFVAKGHAKVPLPIVANYIASELFALLKWWLDRQMPYSPKQMDQMFHDLIRPTVQSVLNNGRSHSSSII